MQNRMKKKEAKVDILSSLPLETTCEILQYCSPRDLVSIRLVSRSWKGYVRQSSILPSILCQGKLERQNYHSIRRRGTAKIPEQNTKHERSRTFTRRSLSAHL